MSDVVLLSEIHPHGTQYFNPLKQAHNWFNLFTPEDISLFEGNESVNFGQAILLIAERCSNRGKQLVIRDWTHLDFTAVPFLKEPSYSFVTADVLRRHCEVIQFATTRHPIDQWLSLRKLDIMQGKLSLSQYLMGYRHFAEKCAEIGFIRYEDFVRTPEPVVQELCTQLKLKYDYSFINKWSAYNKITGDISPPRVREKIEVRKRESVESGLLKQFESNIDYQKALMLLGYRHPS